MAAGTRAEWARLLAGIGAAVSGAALALYALDALPGLIRGLPRGVRELPSVEAGCRALGLPLLLPRRLPAEIAWPPAWVRAVRGRAVAMGFAKRRGSELRAVLCQTPDDEECPELLLAPGQAFHSLELGVAGGSGRLSALRLADGSVWEELAWESAGRGLRLRYQGDTAAYLELARGLGECER